MKKLVLISLLGIGISSSLFGQEQIGQEQKSGCSPQTCGPENTKIGEAVILTELRKDLINLKDLVKVNKGLIEVTEVAIGTDDDESLQIMVKEIAKLNDLLNLKTVNYTGTNAEIVRHLRNNIIKLKNSLNK
jgi:hypothetical protein